MSTPVIEKAFNIPFTVEECRHLQDLCDTFVRSHGLAAVPVVTNLMAKLQKFTQPQAPAAPPTDEKKS